MPIIAAKAVIKILRGSMKLSLSYSLFKRGGTAQPPLEEIKS
jgi:hypothetical protein